MRLKNKIAKRLTKLNTFLESHKKPTLKVIHALRLEVKHLEAFLELMTIQNNFGARPEIPTRLGKLFHEAGRLRKFGMERLAIKSIADQNRITKPTLFLEKLRFFEKKSNKKLRRKRKNYRAFEPGDFSRHPGVRISSDAWQQFMIARATSILDLLKGEILSDIQSLHQLRKILKSILYVLPLCKKDLKPVRVFLKTRKKLIETVESKIGSIHDTVFFVDWLERRNNLIQDGEELILKKIKREWQHDLVSMRKDLNPLLLAVRQVAIDLKGIQ